MYKLILFIMLATITYATDIATVDMEKIFEQYYKTLRADKQLAEHRDYLDEQLKFKIEKRQNLEKSLNKLATESISPLLTVTGKREKARELEQGKDEYRRLTEELNNFQSTATSQLKKTVQEGRVKILKNIYEVIAAYGNENKFDIVLDSNTNINEGDISRVIYANKRTDITDKILKILNDSYEPEVEKLMKEKEARLIKNLQKQNAASKK